MYGAHGNRFFGSRHDLFGGFARPGQFKFSQQGGQDHNLFTTQRRNALYY